MSDDSLIACPIIAHWTHKAGSIYKNVGHFHSVFTLFKHPAKHMLPIYHGNTAVEILEYSDTYIRPVLLLENSFNETGP